MPDWRSDFASSVKDVELSNPVNMELAKTCSQMADRIAALEAEKAALESRASGSKELGAGKQLQLQQSVPDDDPVLSQARLDLAETMRSKGVTEARLRTAEGELDKLRTKNRDDSRLIRNLESERASLMTKLKDRDYELREKRKLVEDVQDEMITLNLQLSVAEKERDKVKQENKDLVDRWMRRMGQEAEAMNLANEHKP